MDGWWRESKQDIILTAAALRLQIAEWASFRNTSLHPLLDAQLAELNDVLASRTYIAGGSRHSLADLLLYAAVSPAAVAFPVAQHGHFCNLLRWYDLLHHTADTQRLFPAAKFERTRYVAPPPPPTAEPKASKDKAGGEKKAAPATAEPAQSSSSSGDKKAGKAAASSAVAAAPADADAVAKADKKVRGPAQRGLQPSTLQYCTSVRADFARVAT
jgi:aminoacyl tRNA synthase complex-interacting multifunctional protein 1